MRKRYSSPAMDQQPCGDESPGGSGGICLGCQNQHGCRADQPPCLILERAPRDLGLGGREWMARQGLLAQCQRCELFRRCWDPDAFRHALG